MGPVYEKLFNIILDSGALPEVWSVGLIKPIYKKGEKKVIQKIIGPLR